ncbi:MAG: hypothetical protein NUV63_12300 [Gallionella sp.]|nr:hypothetical protein [Gallionella sp.]
MEDTEKEQQRRNWHVGREIPIALVAVIILQTAGVVWGAATLNARVDNSEKAMVTALAVQASVDGRQDAEARRSEDRILSQLEKVNGKLDRLIEQGVFK